MAEKLELYDYMGNRIGEPMSLVLDKITPAEFYLEETPGGNQYTVMANMSSMGGELLMHLTDDLEAEIVRQKIYVPLKDDWNQGTVYWVSLENKTLFYAEGDPGDIYFRESDKVMPKWEFRLASDPAILIEEFKNRGFKIEKLQY